jgi:hypothetical protein
MTIKPEDVTQELLELAMERFENAYWNDVSPEQVALFLQDAIDLGLVSPPCHVIRHDVGMYIHDPVYGRKIRVWPGKPPEEHPRAEHYKGQE